MANNARKSSKSNRVVRTSKARKIDASKRDVTVKPPPLAPEQFVVRGHIHQQDGTAAPALTVKAFDKDLRGEQALGQAVTTDKEGRYEIPYTAEQFSRAEKRGADLIVRVYDPDGVELAASDVVFNAPAAATVDLTVDLAAPKLSEYGQLLAALTPVLQDVPIGDLKDEDVEFLAKETGINRQHIEYLQRAAQLAKETDLPSEVFYAFARQDLPPDLKDLLALDLNVLRGAVESSIKTHIIPDQVAENLDAIMRQVRKLQAPQLRIDHVAGKLSLEISPSLTQALEGAGIRTFADIRAAGGLANIQKLHLKPDDPTVKALDAHANLLLLSPDVQVNAKLFEAGFASLTEIASRPRVELVEKLRGQFSDFEIDKMYAQAVAQTRMVNGTYVEIITEMANGRDPLPEDYLKVAGGDVIDNEFLKKNLCREIGINCTCKKCADCESAVSPLAYLADLLKFIKDNVSSGGQLAHYRFLENTLHQKFGSLPRSCESINQEVRQVRICIEVLRGYVTGKLTLAALAKLQQSEREYLISAYQLLLTRLGTSFGELRSVQQVEDSEKKALEERLGFKSPTATFDHLHNLLLDVDTLPVADLEDKLEKLFGLADTRKDPLAPRPTPDILTWRCEYLRSQWLAQDFPDDTPGSGVPIVDPDMIGPDDFRTPIASNHAFALWIHRRNWVDARLSTLAGSAFTKSVTYPRGTTSVTETVPDIEEMLDHMWTAETYTPLSGTATSISWPSGTPKAQLALIYEQLSSGANVAANTAKLQGEFGLGVDAFNRLMELRRKDAAWSVDKRNPKLADQEWREVRSILVQARKQLLSGAWIAEEKNATTPVVLGPKDFWISIKEPAEGDWPPLDYQTRPLIDPELVKAWDLPDSAVHNRATTEPDSWMGDRAADLWETRGATLKAIRQALEAKRRSAGFDAMLKLAWGIAPSASLPGLDLMLQNLDDLDAARAQAAARSVETTLYMPVEAFRTLMAVREKEKQTDPAQKPSQSEYEELCTILTSAQKKRALYPTWLNEEKNATTGVKYWACLKAKLAIWIVSAERRAQWQKALDLRMRAPIIDPDLIGQRYIKNYNSRPEPAAQTIWKGRKAEIEAKLAYLKNRPTSLTPAQWMDQILTEVVGVSSAGFDRLAEFEEKGTSIAPRLAQLDLTPAAFDELVRVVKLLGQSVSVLMPEWDAVYSILTQVWKKRNAYDWLKAERDSNITASPDHFVLAESDDGSQAGAARLEATAWRASFKDRVEWEDNLLARIDQLQALKDSLSEVVDATEKATLPMLRDALVVSAPRIGWGLEACAKKLTDLLLIDMSNSGCAKTTRVSQAIETLQTLLFSLRTGQLRDTYPNLALNSDVDESFDEIWQWLGSYATWRAAMFVLLYPENILLPTLRQSETPGLGQTPAFVSMVRELRSGGRVTPERARLGAQGYSDYFRDVCSLKLKTTVTTKLLKDDGIASQIPQTYLFARAEPSGNVYWATRDDPSRAATQSFWSTIPQLGKVNEIIGAVEYRISDAERYVYLFASIRDGLKLKLVFCRYDLVHPSWIQEANTLQLPKNAATFSKADVLPTTFPSAPPRLSITLNGGSTFFRQLNEEGKDWESEDFKPTPTMYYETFAEVHAANLGGQITAQQAAEWIKAANEFARSKGFAAGIPTFRMTPIGQVVIMLTRAAASPPTWRPISVVGRSDPETVDGLAKRFRDVHNYAKQLGYGSGFPTFDDNSDNYGVVFINKEAVAEGWLTFGEMTDISDFASRFTTLRDTQSDYYLGGFPTFDNSGDATSVVYLIPGQQKDFGSKAPPLSISLFKPEYSGPFRFDPPRGVAAHNAIADSIKNAFERDNKNAPPSILTYFEEAWYFVPLHLALQLQRSGYLKEALDWYRLPYDYSAPVKNRKIYYGLVREEVLTSDITREANWLLDPLNPHAIARTRRNSYTRFTLLSLIRCFLDYADAEFTRDTSESVAFARTLYLTALDLLDAPELKQTFHRCSDVIGELEIKYGDELLEEISALGSVQSPLTLANAAVSIHKIMDAGDESNNRIARVQDVVFAALNEKPPVVTLGEALEKGDQVRAQVSAALLRLPEVAAQVENIGSALGAAIDSAATLVKRSSSGQGAPGFRAPLRDTLERMTKAVGGPEVDRSGRRPPGTNPTAPGFPDLPRGNGLGARLAEIPGIELRRERIEGLILVDGQIRFDEPSGPMQVDFLPWLKPWLVPGILTPALVMSACVPPNPVLAALRQRAQVNLLKIRTCRNIAGVKRQLDTYAAGTDTQSGMPAIGAGGQLVLPGTSTLTPTPYRYSVLIERAKTLVQLAKQVEDSMLSALQQRDSEAYTLLKAQQGLELARANTRLQDIRIKEANDTVEVSQLQRDRAQIQVDQYSNWINEDITGSERAALILLDVAASAYAGTALFELAAIGQAVSANAAGLSQHAAYERRKMEWKFQKNLAEQDVKIGEQQVLVSQDHVQVVQQEKEIAELETKHAEQGVDFLTNKFTNTDLYEWMAGVLEEVYRYFLQQATCMAKLASCQLAFERQETAPPFIQSDYWEAPSEDSLTLGSGKGPDRRGLTGSARLLQDIYQLDQYAFETNKRKLQLMETISLAQLAPVELQCLRETGVMTFATPMELFDRKFPGHYLRLIRRVKVSVIALIPPQLGIRATLTSSGTSRVVTGGDIYQTARLQRGPASVALSSPRDATGLFELDIQSDMLEPFEGIGVDTTWELRMPKAANAFDFTSIADVMLTIEYTALNSFDYQQQVLKSLRPTVASDRAWSFRNHFPDQWWDLHNPEQNATPMTVRFSTTGDDFPPNQQEPRIKQVVLYFVRKDSSTFEIPVSHLHLREPGARGTVGGAATSIDGVVSTRRGNAPSWSPIIGKPAVGEWELALPNTEVIRNRFKNEEVRDILFVITYSGRTPEWPT